MTVSPPASLRDRIDAALMATLAGDALGWRFEVGGIASDTDDAPSAGRAAFQQWRFAGTNEEVLPGETSDDSQLTLALARALVSGGDTPWDVFTFTELPLWSLYQRGGGRATRVAAEALANGDLPWAVDDPKAVRAYFHAGGNGGCIRLAGLIARHAPNPDPLPLLTDALWFTAATHGHPRAFVGAAAQAYAGWLLARGEVPRQPGALVRRMLADSNAWRSPPPVTDAFLAWFDVAETTLGKGVYASLWNDAAVEMEELLGLVNAGLVRHDSADDVTDALGARGPMAGAGTVSVASAIHFASRFAADPLSGVIEAAHMRGTDADSVGSMTGALLGFQHGSWWLPAEWALAQDAELAVELAAALADNLAWPRPKRVMAADLGGIRGAMLEGAIEVDLDGVRAAGVGHPPLAVQTPDGDSFRFRLLTSDNQRLYITLPMP
jgi:ADP-ribosylglycohydrolase